MADETWTVHGTVARVVDGDTVVVDLDLGWKVGLQGEPMRLLGINAPEMHHEGGAAAKDFLVTLLPVGARVQVVSERWGGVREKYGRCLARIEGPSGDVSTAMLEAGHAVVYRP